MLKCAFPGDMEAGKRSRETASVKMKFNKTAVCTSIYQQIFLLKNGSLLPIFFWLNLTKYIVHNDAVADTDSNESSGGERREGKNGFLGENNLLRRYFQWWHQDNCLSPGGKGHKIYFLIVITLQQEKYHLLCNWNQLKKLMPVRYIGGIERIFQSTVQFNYYPLSISGVILDNWELVRSWWFWSDHSHHLINDWRWVAIRHHLNKHDHHHDHCRNCHHDHRHDYWFCSSFWSSFMIART